MRYNALMNPALYVMTFEGAAERAGGVLYIGHGVISDPGADPDTYVTLDGLVLRRVR